MKLKNGLLMLWGDEVFINCRPNYMIHRCKYKIYGLIQDDIN